MYVDVIVTRATVVQQHGCYNGGVKLLMCLRNGAIERERTCVRLFEIFMLTKVEKQLSDTCHGHADTKDDEDLKTIWSLSTSTKHTQ